MFTSALLNGDDLPGWLDFDEATLTYDGTPAVTQTVNLRITATDREGASAGSTFRISVISTEANMEFNNGEDIFFYYDQLNHSAILKNAVSLNGTIRMQIFDIVGHSRLYGEISEESEIVLDPQHFVPGIYIVRIDTGNRQFARKIVIQD